MKTHLAHIFTKLDIKNRSELAAAADWGRSRDRPPHRRPPRQPPARTGLHHGSAIKHNGDYLGASVNLTARVAGTSPRSPGPRHHLSGRSRPPPRCHRRGLGCFELRNIAEGVQLFQIEVCPDAAGSVIDPVCRMQVRRADAAGRLRHRDRDYWFCSSLECASAFTADPDRIAEQRR